MYCGDAFKELDKCPVRGASRYKNNASNRDGGDEHVQIDGNKRKSNGARKGVACNDTSLGTDDEKQSKILALVMWYLLVVNRLRRLFSNPKDTELMRWWDSDKCKKGGGKLRHPANAR